MSNWVFCSPFFQNLGVVEAGLLSRSVFLVMDYQWVELLIRCLVDGFSMRVMRIGAAFLEGSWD